LVLRVTYRIVVWWAALSFWAAALLIFVRSSRLLAAAVPEYGSLGEAAWSLEPLLVPIGLAALAQHQRPAILIM